MGQQATLDILKISSKPMRAIDVKETASKAAGHDVSGGLIARDLQKLKEHGLIEQLEDKTWRALPKEAGKDSAPNGDIPEGVIPPKEPEGPKEPTMRVQRAKALLPKKKGDHAAKGGHKAKPLAVQDRILKLRQERGLDILPEELTVLAREGIMDPDEAPLKWPQEGKNYTELVLAEVEMRARGAADKATVTEAK